MVKLSASIVTTVVLLLYFYYEDHNREPLKRLVEAFVLGMAISLQINYLQLSLFTFTNIFLQAFIMAGLIEEGIKLIALRLTLFRCPDFTQAADGITYAVFLSLGFATVENIILVNTLEAGIIRAFTAVPAHALFAVSMGYYIGLYRFDINNKKLLLLALLVPAVLHGIYNYLIMIDRPWVLWVFVTYIIFLWVKSTRKLRILKKEVKMNEESERLDKGS